MLSRSSRVVATVFPLFCLVLGFLLRPIPTDPDSLIGTEQIAGSFLIFLFWLSSIWNWGRVLQILLGLGSQLGLALGLGTLWAVAVAVTLGQLGFLGPDHVLLFIGTLLVGVVVRPLLLQKADSDTSEPSLQLADGKKETSDLWDLLVSILAVALAVSAFACALIKASVPHLHSDPLYYHLLGPRLWYQSGSIQLSKSIPVTAMGSYWEYLYLWGQQLLGGAGARGLVESQVFAQWTHVTLGFGLSLIVVPKVLGALGASRAVRLVGILAAAQCHFMDWTLGLAKNDWGACAFSMFGSLLLMKSASAKTHRARDWALAGVFFGFAIGIKLSAVFAIPVLTLTVLLGVVDREGFRAAFGRGILFFLAAIGTYAPVAWIHWTETGNPVFPYYDRLFSSPWMTDAILRGTPDAGGGVSAWQVLPDRLLLLWEYTPLILISGIAFVFLGLAKRRISLSETALLTLIGLLATIGGDRIPSPTSSFHLRFFGPVIFMAGALGWLAVFRVVSLIRGAWVSRLLLLAAVLFLGLTIQVPRDDWEHSLEGIAVIPHALRHLMVGGGSKAWLRLNADPTDRIVTTGDNELYYVSNLNISAMTEQPDLDRRWRTSGSEMEFLRRLVRLNVKYVLDTTHFGGTPWSYFADWMRARLNRAPQAVLFETLDSKIVDPKLLLESLDSACSWVSVTDPWTDAIGLF